MLSRWGTKGESSAVDDAVVIHSSTVPVSVSVPGAGSGCTRPSMQMGEGARRACTRRNARPPRCGA
eukprot:3865217-Rhodomonas_salina.1